MATTAPEWKRGHRLAWMRCLQGSLGVGELQRWAEHGGAEKPRVFVFVMTSSNSAEGSSVR